MVDFLEVVEALVGAAVCVVEVETGTNDDDVDELTVVSKAFNWTPKPASHVDTCAENDFKLDFSCATSA